MGLGSASGAAIQRGVEKRLIFSQLIDMQLICQGSTGIGSLLFRACAIDFCETYPFDQKG